MLNLDDLVLTRQQLESIPIAELTNNIKKLHSYEMDMAFGEEQQKISDKDSVYYKFINLMRVSFSFHLSNITQPLSFEPSFIIGNMRSSLPEDFSRNILVTLSIITEKVINPFVASRLNEIIWLNNKSDRSFGVNAIELYANMCKEVIYSLKNEDGKFISSDLIFLSDYLEHGLALSKIIYGRKSEGNLSIKTALQDLYILMMEKNIFDSFSSITELMSSDLKEYDSATLAINAEKMALMHQDTVYFEAVRKLFFTASHLYKRNGMNEDSRRCQISAAMLTVKVKDTSDDPAFKASWLRTAIQELKTISGMSELITQLTQELNEVRGRSLERMAPISIPLDIHEVREERYDALSKRTFSEIILTLVRHLPLENIGKIREDAISHAKEFTFSSMLSVEHLDEHGRKVAVSDGISSTENLNDKTAIAHRLKFIDIDHQFYVHSIFEVARQVIIEKHLLTLDSFSVIVKYTPFVPDSLKGIFSLGFYRLWQGDYLGACYLLLPNMESAIRHVYELSGKDTTRLIEKGLEEGTSLTILLSKAREDLESIFSEDIILTVDMMFLEKVGPSLRHRIAHGNLSTNACYASASIFSCCLMLYLCCVPLLDHWDKLMDEDLKPKKL